MGRGRTGGIVAVILSSLWGASGLFMAGVGAWILIDARDDPNALEGFAGFFGGSLAVAGALVLAAAGSGLYLGIRLFRGRPRAGLTAALFGLFAVLSGVFLSSAIYDQSGADPGAIALFGANTAVCVFVVLAAVAARRA